MAVRLDKDLRATIDKVVASYNRKINYYKRQGFNVLPEKTTYQEIVNLGSRKAIKQELKLMENLNRKNLDSMIYNGNLTTRYEMNYYKAKINRAKRILRGRIKNLSKTELKMYGKSTGFTMGDRFNINELTGALQQGKIRSDKLIANIRKYDRLRMLDLSDLLKPDFSDLKESVKNLLNRVENPLINTKLKESYLESLTDLGYAYGYDKDKLAEIEKKLKGLSNEEFEKLFTEDIGMQRVFSYYDILKMNIGSNFLDNQEDVFNLYDNLYNNIDDIIGKSKQ